MFTRVSEDNFCWRCQSQEDANVENGFLQCFPNPATKEVTIGFEIPNNQNASMDLINIFGQKIKILVGETMFNAGNQRVKIPLDDIPSGLYFIRLNLATGTVCEKFVVE